MAKLGFKSMSDAFLDKCLSVHGSLKEGLFFFNVAQYFFYQSLGFYQRTRAMSSLFSLMEGTVGELFPERQND